MTTDNKQQLVASAGVGARQIVLAGPGTGKTETVALRLESLLRTGVKPAQILVLSFSRSAVRTLVRRLEKYSKETAGELEDLRHISIRTFDSWTFRILRQLGEVPRDLMSRTYDQNITHLVNLVKGERRDEVHALLKGIRHVIIDEFQDLTGVRAELVLTLLDLLAPVSQWGVGFTVLGDEAQAIYGFSTRDKEKSGNGGLSSAKLIKAIRENYKCELEVVELDKNYRSVPNLANLAVHLRKILVRNASGTSKLSAMKKLFSAIPEEGLGLSPEMIGSLSDDTAAILTRTNGEAIRVYQKIMGNECRPPAVSVVLAAGKQPHHVPAWVGATLGRVQGVTVTRSQFQKIYRHLYAGSGLELARKLEIPDEESAWKRLLKAAEAGAGATSVDLKQLRSRLEWPDLFPDDDAMMTGTIHITTIHQSKGREFDKVTLVDSDYAGTDSSSEGATLEEASVIFVGVTRAGKLLTRIPAGQLYPLTSWPFEEGRRNRWGMWRNGWINMEMGIPGDVSDTSFVDTRLHNSESEVNQLQEFLALNAPELRGRKVMLRKIQVPGKEGHFVYAIHLQEGTQPERLLGHTSERLTFDLLHRLGKNYYLPSSIFNLRITDVVTMGLHGDDVTGLATGWTTSGLWLGVNIYGTGDFKPVKRSAHK
ncbi:AAA family ATPase [Betaproteobacteria bacterium SCN2]|jgi:hypothetical protein|nr:AAA family ATPase [Betaproteobacteria bacterium SCN2]